MKNNNIDIATTKPGYLGRKGDKGIIAKGDVLIHKRSKKDYKNIWEYFIINESNDYCERMGYTVSDIEKIGINKFIDTQDWRNTEDVSKWSTDAIHIIPCANCSNEFTTFQIDAGVCSKCKPVFDMARFSKDCNDAEAKMPGMSLQMLVAFIYDKTTRDKYKNNKI